MAAMPGLKERAKTLVELIDARSFLCADRPLALDDKADGAADRRGPRRCSASSLPRARGGRALDAPRRPKQAVRAFAERKGVKLGAVAQPLRAALTGRTTSPGIFDVLAVLGRQESLARLRDQAGAG